MPLRVGNGKQSLIEKKKSVWQKNEKNKENEQRGSD